MSFEWWKRNVIYHLYLPSFKDGNGDGVGDFQGLTSKLDYFKDVRISTLLLSPFYPSPMKDNGYDITDYTGIDPIFGNMNDFDFFMAEIKRRNMNVIIDFVANHTSVQHPWFIKSINRENPFTDFYIWVDSVASSEDVPIPPNNWLSVFGGSAWTWNEKRKQFYLHQFLPEQPDLNYRNPIVKHEIVKILIFWLEKGVDGFRIDAASHIFEDSRFLDEPVARQSSAKENEYDYLNHIYTRGMPETLELLKEWRKILDDYSKKFKKPKIMLTEVSEETKEMMQYYGFTHDKISEIPMNFLLYKVTVESTALEIRDLIDEWLKNMPKGKLPNFVMSSHDFPRVATRLGNLMASSLQMVVMLLPGIPICYYGDELGMENGVVAPERTRDGFALRTNLKNSRDPSRTPMLWNCENNAGFSDCDNVWLPVNADYLTKNVEMQSADPFSFLSNFKKLVAIRNNSSVLVGKFTYLLVNPKILSFTCTIYGGKCFLVIVNTSDDQVSVNLRRDCADAELPLAARLEVTNPQYYTRTMDVYREISNSAQGSTYSAHSRPVMILLENVSLEAKQGVVLSFPG